MRAMPKGAFSRINLLSVAVDARPPNSERLEPLGLLLGICGIEVGLWGQQEP